MLSARTGVLPVCVYILDSRKNPTTTRNKWAEAGTALPPRIALSPAIRTCTTPPLAAEVHFHRRREPAQVVSIALLDKEGSFREVHLLGHGLHPGLALRRGQKTNGGRVAGEWPVGEGITWKMGIGMVVSVYRRSPELRNCRRSLDTPNLPYFGIPASRNNSLGPRILARPASVCAFRPPVQLRHAS